MPRLLTEQEKAQAHLLAAKARKRYPAGSRAREAVLAGIVLALLREAEGRTTQPDVSTVESPIWQSESPIYDEVAAPAEERLARLGERIERFKADVDALIGRNGEENTA